MKTCTICRTEKPYSEFHKQASRKDGYGNWCKPCKSIRKREQYQRDRDRVLERVANYRKENPEKVAAAKKAAYQKKPDYYRDMHRKYYEENREKKLEYSKAHREKNKERIRKRDRAYKALNRRRLSQRQREYYRNNREDRLAYHAKYRADNADLVASRLERYRKANKHKINRYRRERMVNNPAFRMACWQRAVLRKVLERVGKEKDAKCAELLGYSPRELKEHIERQFTKGMSWDLMGSKIHIDHIVPVAEMIASGETDPAVINALTNLRPVLAYENLKKGATRTHLI